MEYPLYDSEECTSGPNHVELATPAQPDSACENGLAQQLCAQLQEKLEDVMHAALLTTFDKIFAQQITSVVNKIQADQRDFLDRMDDLIRDNIVREPSTSIGPKTSLGARQAPMTSALPSIRADDFSVTKLATNGRLKMRQMDKLHIQDILRNDKKSNKKLPHQVLEESQSSSASQRYRAGHINDEDGHASPQFDECVPSASTATPESAPGCILSDATNASTRTKAPRMKKLREETVNKLVMPCDSYEITSDNDTRREVLLCRVWAVWGILPWNQSRYAQWYRCCMILASFSSTAWSLYCVVRHPADHNFVLTLVSLCTFAGLMALRSITELVGPFNALLVHHAGTRGFLRDWVQGGLRTLAMASCIWLSAGLVGIVVCSTMDGTPAIILIALFYQMGLFLAIIHCLSQLLTFLDNMVDGYCMECFEGLRCNRAVYAWNVLQGLLRHVAKIMDNCLVCLQVFLMLAFLWLVSLMMEIMMQLPSKPLEQLVAEMRERGSLPGAGLALLWLLVMGPSAIMIFVKAAGITEQCFRVPGLVNSMVAEPEEQLNLERQYLVGFIMNSDAGFYLKGVKLTAAMMVKACYLFSAIVCTLGTTALSMNKRNSSGTISESWS